MDYTDYEAGIVVGDAVWWGPWWDWQDYQEPRLFPISKEMYRYSFTSGTVRGIGFEEPDFSYAIIARNPDGGILQVPLHWLSKGTPPGPITEIDMSLVGEDPFGDDGAAPTDDDREVDELIEEWGAQQP